MSHSKRFQWDEIQALSNPETNIIALTHVGAILLHACAVWYDNRSLWFVGDEPVNDTEWNDISKIIGLMEHQIMSGLVGVILPHVLGSLSGFAMLPCDGSVYLRADWPLLYEALSSEYILDADSFFVPDLRDKMLLGEGVEFALDETGGEIEHTLDESEMPAHSHTNFPHSHGEIIAVPSIAGIGVDAPVPSATPSAGSTSPASITIDSTGGSQAHNNMPPFRVVKFAIVAG